MALVLEVIEISEFRLNLICGFPEHLRKRPFITIDETELRTVLRIEAEKVWEKPVTLDVGTSVLFPILAIHHDPKNYHQPDKFEPERFSNENRTEIKPFTYFPFGIPSSHTGKRMFLDFRLDYK